MTPDELLTHLEAELARARDERDRLRGELELALSDRDTALRESALAQRMLIAAEQERDRLHGALQGLVASKSWALTRPLRRLTGSDRPEDAEAF